MTNIIQINNSYASQNSYTLNYLLKNELDFQGFGKCLDCEGDSYLMVRSG